MTVAGGDEANALSLSALSSVLDGSAAFDWALPASKESAACPPAGSCTSLILLLEGNEDISRGVDEVGTSDCD